MASSKMRLFVFMYLPVIISYSTAQGDFDICAAHEVSVSDRAYITSPNYPLNYPANQNCAVAVMAPIGNILKIQLIAFAIPCSSVNRNRLVVRDQENWNVILLDDACGTDIQFCILSPMNSVRIEFIAADSAKGFSLLTKVMPSGTTIEAACQSNMTRTVPVTTLTTIKAVTTPRTTEPSKSSTISGEQNMNNSDAGAVTQPVMPSGTTSETAFQPITTTEQFPAVNISITTLSHSMNESMTEPMKSSTRFYENTTSSHIGAMSQQSCNLALVIGTAVGGTSLVFLAIGSFIVYLILRRQSRLSSKAGNQQGTVNLIPEDSAHKVYETTSSRNIEYVNMENPYIELQNTSENLDYENPITEQATKLENQSLSANNDYLELYSRNMENHNPKENYDYENM